MRNFFIQFFSDFASQYINLLSVYILYQSGNSHIGKQVTLEREVCYVVIRFDMITCELYFNIRQNLHIHIAC